MSLPSWFHALRGAAHLQPSRPRHRSTQRRRLQQRRLLLEGLEDRRLLSFTPAMDYAAGLAPQAVVAADFNNDGQLDLAVANSSSNSVNALLGNANGTFQPAVTSAAGFNPASIAVGDFNIDGKLDLVAANGGTNGVSVMLGNGDGSFRTPSNIDLGSEVASVAVGDLNNDGKMDLVATSNAYYPISYSYYSYYYSSYPYQGEAHVLLSIGDGSFSAPRSYWFMDRRVYSAVVGDFNGDGNQDVVVHKDYSEVSMLLGDGQGNLGGSWYNWAASDAFSMAAGDVNGDGNADLVTTDGYSSVGVLLSNGAGGFTSTWPEYYTAGDQPTSVLLGDFDRDGLLDITTSNSGSNDVSVLRGRGDGTFGEAERFAAGPGAFAVAAGDFNGDGWLDVATANPSGNSVSVLINDQVWAPLPPDVSVSDATVTEGNTGALSASFTVSLSAPTNVDVTVHYQTVDVTALAGSDYAAASGTVTIPAGQTSKTFTVPIIGDRLAEPTETFAVQLSAPTNATIHDVWGTGTIVDNEPRISISDVTKYEGKRNKTTYFTFTVTLSAAYDQAVSMSFRTVDGTATTGNGDYVAKTGTLTFNPGETTKTITIAVKGDSIREANELFYLDLFNNSSNSLFNKNRGIGTILNDDR